MKQKQVQQLFVAMALCISTSVFAQESSVASGGEATGTTGTVSYSIGQVSYSSESGSGGEISQGVQQAYEIFTLSVKKSKFEIALKVFPNPTRDILNLDVTGYQKGKLSYHLYDAQGRLVQSNLIDKLQNQINTSDLEPAIYYLHVMHSKKKIQTFKIIKN